MATKTDKTHYATRDFTDAGTTRRFERGEKIEECSDGELGNYAAAGLASTDKPPKDAIEAETIALDKVLG